MGRAPCCDKASVKRGPWSPEEDATLRSYIETHGIGGNWIALPQKAGLQRCGKSCRLRWLNYLRPDIKHGGFTEEEDNIIYTLFNKIGSRWSVIASHLPGRTDNDLKNYWNTKLKKKLSPAQKPKQTPLLAYDDNHNASPFDWGFGFVDQDPYPILPELPLLPTFNESSAASSSIENNEDGFFSEMCFGNYGDLLNAQFYSSSGLVCKQRLI